VFIHTGRSTYTGLTCIQAHGEGRRKKRKHGLDLSQSRKLSFPGRGKGPRASRMVAATPDMDLSSQESATLTLQSPGGPSALGFGPVRPRRAEQQQSHWGHHCNEDCIVLQHCDAVTRSRGNGCMRGRGQSTSLEVGLVAGSARSTRIGRGIACSVSLTEVCRRPVTQIISL